MRIHLMSDSDISMKSAETLGRSPERLICACFGLTDRAIISEFERCQSSYDALVQKTLVGTKCTACLLDLDLLLDGMVRRTSQKGNGAIVAHGVFVKPEDQCHCAHFVNGDDITTVLRVANHGLMFESGTPIAPHDYRLVIFAADGKVIHRRSGRLRAGATLEVRFAEIQNLPASGWFIIDLVPRGNGVVGSLRPQIGMAGPRWAATFHPQWLSFRTCRRAVLAAIEDGRPDLWPVLINPGNIPVDVDVALLGIDAEFRGERRIQMAGRSLAEIDLAPIAQRSFTGTALCAIESSHPIMFYIVNKHRDGSWCLDHFPNEK